MTGESTSGASRGSAGDRGVIEAAGGVVLRHPTGGDVEVLVIHRQRYDDWSLPKGKLDPGEGPATAAVREVAEETGVIAELGDELDSVTYEVPAGTKLVRWFRMRPLDGDPARRPADREVDIARWLPVEEAPAVLTYDHDRHVLSQALAAHGDTTT